MKKVIISLVAGAVLLVGALTALAITSSNNSTAAASEATDQADATIDGLVDAGFIGDTLADFLHELVQTIEDSGVEIPEPDESDAIDPDELKDMLEDFDFSQVEDWLSRIDGFDFGELNGMFGEGFGQGFGEGFAFDFDDLQKRFGNFDFGELPKFEHHFEGNGPNGFFGEGPFSGLTPDELKDAFENGTLDELVDWDAFIADALARAEEHLDRAVESGRLTQAEADEKLAEIKDHLDNLASGGFDFFGPHWFNEARGAGANA